MSAITFEVIDLTCESSDQTFFPPKVTMTTKSTTQIATVRGFPEYVGFASIPPKLYKTCTWEGTSEQTLKVNGVQIGGARFDYSGSDVIDENGTIISNHVKNLFSQCDGNPEGGFMIVCHTDLLALFAYVFTGYYGMNVLFPHLLGHPTILCDTSNIPFTFVADQSVVGPLDSSNLWGAGIIPGTVDAGISNFVKNSSTNASSTDTGESGVTVVPYLPKNEVELEIVSPPPDFFSVGLIDYTHNYSCTLSDEYTDAEALANAVVVLGNGATAQNLPRTTGFVSTFTNVIYTLTFTSLIVGNSYIASVDLWDTGTGTTTVKNYPFQATQTTQSIVDIVPFPPSQHTLQVRNPRIVFVP